MEIVLFEDEKFANFLPLVYTRPVYELRVGALPLRSRVQRELEGELCLYTRAYLAPHYASELKSAGVRARVNPGLLDDCALLLNGRLLGWEDVLGMVAKLASEKEEFVLVSGGCIAAAKTKRPGELISSLVTQDTSSLLRELRKRAEVLEGEVPMLEFPWDLIKYNRKMLERDLGERGAILGEIERGAVLKGPVENVYVGEGAIVETLAVLDARAGPVYVGEGAEIRSCAVVKGPAYIGPETIVVEGARVREGSNIGRTCRIGGEVEESVFHAYSNKYHDGFVGHSYIGEWVNLGALTTTSDLKNTYGTIRMELGGRTVDTGMLKIGSFIGDMTKTSVGVLIYSGRKVGVSSHLHGVVAEDVPSFTIYARSIGAGSVELYLESAIETQRRMMRRRGKEMGRELEELIRYLFEATKEERERAGVERGEFRAGSPRAGR